MDGLVETLRDHPDKVIAVAVIFATGEWARGAARARTHAQRAHPLSRSLGASLVPPPPL
jgi:hypothetical protein